MNRSTATIAAACAAFACAGAGDATGSDTRVSDPSGILRVNVTTVGLEYAPDRYTVTLDDSVSRAIDANGTVDFTLADGEHTLRVTGASADCRILGEWQVFRYHHRGNAPDTLVRDVAVDCVAPLPDRFDDVILFVSGTGSTADVYAVRPDGSGLVNVTHDWVANYWPAVSPDGRRIAFVSGCTEGCTEDFGCACIGLDGPTEIMTADRSERTGFGHYAHALAWSPDGTRMAFVAGLYCSSVYTMVLGGGGPPVSLASGTDPAWSPDGSRLAFSGGFPCAPMGDDMYVMNADGTNPEQLTADSTRDSEPAWSPDGALIAFTRGYWLGSSAPSRIYVMRADGAGLAAITSAATSSWSPAWSPDGTRIAFISQSPDPSDAGVYLMNADGSNVHRIVTDSHARDVIWAPRAIAGSLIAR